MESGRVIYYSKAQNKIQELFSKMGKEVSRQDFQTHSTQKIKRIMPKKFG